MAVDTRRARAPVSGRPPQTYSLQYVEEDGGTRLRVAQRRRRGHMRRRSRLGVRNAGWPVRASHRLAPTSLRDKKQCKTRTKLHARSAQHVSYQRMKDLPAQLLFPWSVLKDFPPNAGSFHTGIDGNF